jgi:hypothetical protein
LLISEMGRTKMIVGITLKAYGLGCCGD